MKTVEQRIDLLEKELLDAQQKMVQIAEHLANQSHLMHLIARQLRQISAEIDIDINPPRTQ